MDMILVLVMCQVGAPWAFTVGNIHVIFVSELMPLSFVLWKLCACNVFRSHMVAGTVLWNFVDLHTQSVCCASSSFLPLKTMKILKLIKKEPPNIYHPPQEIKPYKQSWGLLVQFPLPINHIPPSCFHPRGNPFLNGVWLLAHFCAYLYTFITHLYILNSAWDSFFRFRFYLVFTVCVTVQVAFFTHFLKTFM